MIKKIRQYLRYKSQRFIHLALEDRLFIVLLDLSLFISVLNVILNQAIGFRFDANYKWFVMFFTAIIAIRFQLKGKHSSLIKNLIFAEIIFIFLPNGWLVTQGASYSTMGYVFLITTLICLVFKGKTRIFFVLSEVLVIVGLMYYDYVMRVSFSSVQSEVLSVDAMVQVPIAILTTAFILILFSNAYRKEGEILSEYSRLLEERNLDLTKIAITDELTGVYNRRYIFQKLDEIKAHINLMKYSVNVAIIDIDNFKTINDAFGHVAGDRVLKSVSDKMIEIVGERGYVGRHGGDEFIIVLNDLSYKESRMIVDCIRQEISDLEVFEDFKVTISGGLTRFNQTDEVDDVLVRADEMLYRAKRDSKNLIM